MRVLPLALLALFLTACGEKGDTGGSETCTWYIDEDGDGYGDPSTATESACDNAPTGYVAGDTGGVAFDCDDSDDAVNPGAEEYCDDVDNDCDGDIDEDGAVDGTKWYEDRDGDGFGDAGSTLKSCSPPTGYVLDYTDCDDSDAAVNPDATEICEDGIDNDCDGMIDEGTTWYADDDGDGYGDAGSTTEACEAPSSYVADDSDCDDSDASVNPDALEICDSIDNDCDGDIDEGRTTTYCADADEDGFGDTADTTEACSAPSGYVWNCGDCDDSDDAVNPEATEHCDGVDNDCDGDIDERATTTYYADDDEDGFGDTADTTEACSAPSGYVSDDSDCDDSDDAVNPDATETCEDGIDNNCDGMIDDESIWYADNDGDGFGDAGNSTEGCPAPSGYVSDFTDCDDTDGTVNPGTSEDHTTPEDDDCDGSTVPPLGDAAIARFIGEEREDDAGHSVSNAGDVDGDGYDDILVGAPFNDEGGSKAGAAYLVYGPVSGDLDLGSADARLIGEYAFDRAGYSVSGAGDLDGDGYDDILVGAPYNDEGGSSAGAAYLVYGALSNDLDLSDHDAMLIGQSECDEVGMSVSSAGDIDGDGHDDMLVGAPGGGSDADGAAYLVYGPVSGDLGVGSADAKLDGHSYGEYAGTSVDSAGDVDGDGYDDILVGAPGSPSGEDCLAEGVIFLVYGPITGDFDMDDADATLRDGLCYDDYGISVSSAGDVDGDGFDDILVGAPYNDEDGSNDGAAYLTYGPVTGGYEKLVGEDGCAGISVSITGDVDGDGFDDILVGASYHDEGGSNAGIAYLVYETLSADLGLSHADFFLMGENNSDHAGESVSGAGDVDGDGYDDILVGAPDNDEGGAQAGIAYLILGG